MNQPNILWICTDQQRWDSLGCYANPFVRTPNLDRLAAQGTLFEHCYCQSPVDDWIRRMPGIVVRTSIERLLSGSIAHAGGDFGCFTACVMGVILDQTIGLEAL